MAGRGSQKYNTTGTLYGEAPGSGKAAEAAHPELSGVDALQLVLDLAGMVPGAGAVPDLINAAVSALRGDWLGAGLSLFSAAPGVGDAVGAAKIVKNGDKYLQALKVVETKVIPKLPDAIAKPLQEFVGKARKKLEELMGSDKAKPELPKKDAPEPEKPKGKKEDNAQVKGKKKQKKPGPCDHLRQGSGKGPYRGGAHSKTSKPANDGKDSHHMPADDVSPIARNDGPAIQMDPSDHRETSSNGNKGRQGAAYRKMIEGLLKNGKWREAMTIEIRDIRRIVAALGYSTKYNEAMLEMLEYFKCLEKNKLLG